MTALATPSRRPGTRRTPITEPGDPTTTMTTLRPNSRAVTSTWHFSVVALPAEPTLVRQARTPDAEVVLYWAHRVRVGADLDEFIATFPSSSTSHEFRSQHRRGTHAGLAFKITRSPELHPYLPELVVHSGDRRGPALYGTNMSGLVLGVGMGSASLATSTTGYSLAVACAVSGEIVVFVAASDVLNRISPPGSRALYAGIWGTTLAAAVLCAPLLGGWALHCRWLDRLLRPARRRPVPAARRLHAPPAPGPAASITY
ncbi:hypothetical protein ACWD25_19605 [Streptomyces sp. NPDC002920]